MQKLALSVVINTKNAADTLQQTLDSVQAASEIVVVDMGSTDATRQIAAMATTHIFDHPDVGFVEPARNFAVSKASEMWVLVLDADEVVPESLWRKLPELLAREEVSCYELPRRNTIFGKQIEKTGWWPDYQARLFRKDNVRWSDKIHQPPQICGKTEKLPASDQYALQHRNYTSVGQFIEKLNRYTSITANEVQNNSERVTAAQLVRQFDQQLLSRLFAQAGIDEGVHGVGLSYLQSMYELVMLLKKWEKQGSRPTQNDQAAVLVALQAGQSELRYWIADWKVKNSRGMEKYIWLIRRKFCW